MPKPGPIARVAVLGSSVMLTAMAVAVASAMAQENGTKPQPKVIDGDAVLTSRGFTKVGNLYLLKEELEVKDEIKKGEDALNKMEAKGQALRQSVVRDQENLTNMEIEVRTLQQQRDALDLQRQRLTGQAMITKDANSQLMIRDQTALMDIQIHGKQDSIERINQTFAMTQTQFQTQQQNLRTLENEYNSKLAEHEKTFAGVKAKYQPFMRDPEVIQALEELNRKARPWVMIGPSWSYGKNVKLFAQTVLNNAGIEISYTTVVKKVGKKSTKVKAARATLAKQEKDVRAVGYQARLLEPKLNGPDGTARREELSTTVSRLKKSIADVQQTHAELSKDALIASAIEQAAPGAKLELTDEFKSYVRRLPDQEKMLKTKK